MRLVFVHIALDFHLNSRKGTNQTYERINMLTSLPRTAALFYTIYIILAI